ncbi:MAG: ABC transporter ATP-binding protein [Leptothrix sp. (in: b-proteobacteria)]
MTRAAGQGLRVRGLGFAVPADEAGAGAPAARRWVLRGLDLDLPAGAQAALTGPSGSGKSTLLHLLAGLATPDEGDVCFGADLISRWPTTRRELWRRQQVGLVFQQFHLFGALSALDNLLLPWTFDHLRIPAPARAHARDLLAQLGVREQARCAVLSRGEQQRVAVARALVRQPALVLADEPTASLDPAHAAEACALLQRLCERHGAALVVATHDPSIAARFDTRIELQPHTPTLTTAADPA